MFAFLSLGKVTRLIKPKRDEKLSEICEIALQLKYSFQIHKLSTSSCKAPLFFI